MPYVIKSATGQLLVQTIQGAGTIWTDCPDMACIIADLKQARLGAELSGGQVLPAGTIWTSKRLRKLARKLTYKADIYTIAGRLYGYEAKFSVRDCKLFHGAKELNPDALHDGNGRQIFDD